MHLHADTRYIVQGINVSIIFITLYYSYHHIPLPHQHVTFTFCITMCSYTIIRIELVGWCSDNVSEYADRYSPDVFSQVGPLMSSWWYMLVSRRSVETCDPAAYIYSQYMTYMWPLLCYYACILFYWNECLTVWSDVEMRILEFVNSNWILTVISNNFSDTI